MDGTVLDEAFERFAHTGFEFGGGLSNHGPMAAEALVAMGRDGDVLRWSEGYATRLGDAPRGTAPIAGADWREALGDIKRLGDWVAFFEKELAAQPWQQALDLWAGRLAPGIFAAATHGVLRTAHAVRALQREQTPARRHELAAGLAYWAARYSPLPTAPAAAQPQTIEQIMLRVPIVPAATKREFFISGAVGLVDPAQFGPLVNEIDPGADAGAFVSKVTGTFVRHYLADGGAATIAFIHTVTAPSSLRHLAPHLQPDTLDAALRYGWQACAGVYAAHAALGRGATAAETDAAAIEPDDVIAQAVAGGDEHGIKFTEACLREHRISGDGAFLTAAQDAVRRLAPAGRIAAFLDRSHRSL